MIFGVFHAKLCKILNTFTKVTKADIFLAVAHFGVVWSAPNVLNSKNVPENEKLKIARNGFKMVWISALRPRGLPKRPQNAK